MEKEELESKGTENPERQELLYYKKVWRESLLFKYLKVYSDCILYLVAYVL